MISVSGQLIDRLRAMKDLMSSLLKNVSGLIMSSQKIKVYGQTVTVTMPVSSFGYDIGLNKFT